MKLFLKSALPFIRNYFESS